ncbi:hypothetical protein D3C76_947570 [compost metagenome]
MMPISARMPRIATKPIGVPVGTSASTTPIRPSGATLATRNIFCTLCSWIIRKVAIRNTINGTTWLIGPWALALSSTVPPVATLYPAGNEAAKVSMSGLSSFTRSVGWISPITAVLMVIVGLRSRRHTSGCSSS